MTARRATSATTTDGGKTPWPATTTAGMEYRHMPDGPEWGFSQEKRRRQDIIRFGIFTTRSWFYHDAGDATRNLSHIPNKQVQGNGKLKHTHGYQSPRGCIRNIMEH